MLRGAETALTSSLIKFLIFALAPLALAALAGCTIHPPGEREERATAARLGKAYEPRPELRTVSPLPDNATPDQLVQFALLNNADLEDKYWTWRAAIEQIPQDGTQSTNLNIAAGTSIVNGHASWGNSNVTVGNDPMTDIKWPGKLDAAAKQSLENARAAGRRFVKAKFELRGSVLGAYYDYALSAELIRLEQSNLQLLQTTAEATASRNRAGSASQQDLLKAKNEVDMSGNDIANMQSQLPAEQAMINALLGRAADAPLPMPSEFPRVRPVAYADGQLLKLAARYNPELLALADENHGRQQGVRLARLQYVPDFNISVGTDLEGVAQSLLTQATVPFLRYEAINAAIDQANANLRATEATQRQTGNDLASQVVSDITTIRDADRQLDLFEHAILPRARQSVDIGRTEYETGHSTFLDLLDSQRSLIAIQRLIAILKATREKHLVDLEAITTIDLSNQHEIQSVIELR